MEGKKMIIHAAGVCTALLVCVTAPVTAHAGGINAQEAGVVAAASQTFAYNGQQYRASAGYVSQLRSYLAGDGVDLTAAEARALIADIHANVASGVEQGYLEPVGGTPDDDGSADGSGQGRTDEKMSGDGTLSEDVEKGTSDDGSAQADTGREAADDGNAQAGAQKGTFADETARNPDQETSGNGPADGRDVSDSAAGRGASRDGTRSAGAARAEKKECIIRETPNQTVVYDQDGKKVFQTEAIMKDTGYSHSTRTRVLLASVFGGFLLAGAWMAAERSRHSPGSEKGGGHEA